MEVSPMEYRVRAASRATLTLHDSGLDLAPTKGKRPSAERTYRIRRSGRITNHRTHGSTTGVQFIFDAVPASLFDAAKRKKFGELHKQVSYFEDYDRNFGSLRDTQIALFEVGVSRGGSLAMWKEYFPRSEVTGLDIDMSCKQFERDGVSVYIGSQEDGDLLRRISAERGPFDIVIDDGGHTMKQQIETFKVLFPLLKDGGTYVIEDLHTSYWSEFGGRKKRRYTAIGFIKDLIDSMHYWAIRHPRVDVLHRIRNKIKPYGNVPKDYFEENVRSIYIGDSIAFIRKGEVGGGEAIKL